MFSKIVYFIYTCVLYFHVHILNRFGPEVVWDNLPPPLRLTLEGKKKKEKTQRGCRITTIKIK